MDSRIFANVANNISSGGTVNGSLTIDGDLTVNGDGSGAYDEIVNGNFVIGSDGSGHDVIFYSDTAGDNFTWDSSAEKLTITGTNGATALDVADGNLVVADNVDIEGDIDVNGTANLDAVDIDGAVQLDSTLTIGADDQGYDVIFYGDTASSNMTWDTSEDDLVLNDSRLFIDQDDDMQALRIDCEAAAYNAVNITAKYGLQVTQDISSGRAANFTRNIAETGSSPLVLMTDDHASNTQPTLKIQQDGAGYGISIDHNANSIPLYIDHDGVSNYSTIYIDTPATTTGAIIYVDGANSLTSGIAAKFTTASTNLATTVNSGFVHIKHSGDSDTNVNNLLLIENDDAGSTGTTGLYIQQDSTGPALVTTGSVGIGTATVDEMLHLESGTADKPVLQIENTNADNSSGTIKFVKNPTDSSEADADMLGGIYYYGNDDANNSTNYAFTRVMSTDVSNGSEDGEIDWAVMKDGSFSYMTFKSGLLGVGTESPSQKLSVNNSANGTQAIASFLNTEQSNDAAEIYIGSAVEAKDSLIIGYETASDNSDSSYGYLKVHGQTGIFIRPTGDIGIGVSPTYRLDILDDVSPQLNITSSSSNDTAKYAHITCGHYHNAEEPITLVEGRSDGSNNYARIGGGRSEGNSVNYIEFYLGANDATVGGTRRFNLDTNSRISLSNNDSGGTGGSGSTTGNTLFGYLAGTAIASGGIDNTLVGHASGTAISTGDRNVAIGVKSLDAMQAGTDNISIGYDTMGNANNSSTLKNIAIGNYALDAISTNAQTGVIAIGHEALTAMTSGGSATSGNVAIGYQAAATITDGSSNVSIGYQAMASSHTTSTQNVVVGRAAMQNSTGSASNNNTGIGHGIFGGTMNAASDNVAVGHSALGSLTTADECVIVGAYAGDALTSGTKNTALGANALSVATTALYNTAVGFNAMSDVAASQAIDGCVAIGYEAMKGSGSTTTGAHYSVAIGKESLKAITTGANNVAIGYQSMIETTQGNYNTAIGYQAMNQDAGLANVHNTFIGQGIASGDWTSTASTHNTGVGSGVMQSAMNGATYNVGIGADSLNGLTTGDNNTAVGSGSADVITTSNNVVAIGYNALGAATTQAHNNVAIGHQAMSGNWTTANVEGAVAIGANALDAVLTSTASNTIAIGFEALGALTSGASNVAIGYNALTQHTTGGANVAIGHGALSQTGGNVDYAPNSSHNIAVGYNALGGDWNDATQSNYNIAIGGTSQDGVLNGACCNVSMGFDSLGALTEGDSNVAIGHNVANSITTGGENVVIGSGAGIAMTTNTLNTVIGKGAFAAADAGEDANVIIGHGAGDAINDGGSDANVIIGFDAGIGGAAAMLSCVVIGRDAMRATAGNAQTGTVAIGKDALGSLTTGSANTAIGHQAGLAIVEGQYNTVLGYQAFDAGEEDSRCVAIGYQALTNADVSNTGSPVDSGNTAVGFQAGESTSTGKFNTYLGGTAGDALTTGSNNTYLGYGTEASAVGASNQTMIGSGATGQADNSVTLGNASVDAVYAAQDGDAVVYCGGINMSLNQPAAAAGSMSSEHLDAYEEGTWTPALSPASGTIGLSTAQGSYTKVGRIVHIQMYIATDAISSPSGRLTITGLPFTIASSLGNAISNAYPSGLTGDPGGSIIVRGYSGSATMFIDIDEGDGTDPATDISNHFDASSELSLSLTYAA